MPLACLGEASSLDVWNEAMRLHDSHGISIPNIAENHVRVLANFSSQFNQISYDIEEYRNIRKPKGHWQTLVLGRCNPETFIDTDEVLDGFTGRKDRQGIGAALRALYLEGKLERIGKPYFYQYRLIEE